MFVRLKLLIARPLWQIIEAEVARRIAEQTEFGFRRALNRMISFIIPAHNEEALIGPTLTALTESAHDLGGPWEIIVVDDDSSDRTGAIAERHGARVVRGQHRQIAATRNEGARAACGDRLIFIDADTLVNHQVVKAAIRAMRDGAVGGGCEIRFDATLPAWARFLHPLFS